MGKGLFITTEGTDGSGKTTQIRLIKSYLEEKGCEVILTREPGGTKISEKIRDIILNPENKEMSPITEMMLYVSARAQLVAQVIKPVVESGKIVICDRFVDSSLVYQGFGRGIDLTLIEDINKIAMDGINPDITFFFDISPEVALKRRIASTGADRIESEKMDFHMKVYEGYKKLAKLFPDRIKSINANRPIDDISLEVREWLDRLI